MLRKSSLENAFDVKFVQKVTLKANAQKSSLENAFGTKYVQNLYFKGYSASNAF